MVEINVRCSKRRGLFVFLLPRSTGRRFPTLSDEYKSTPREQGEKKPNAKQDLRESNRSGAAESGAFVGVVVGVAELEAVGVAAGDDDAGEVGVEVDRVLARNAPDLLLAIIVDELSKKKKLTTAIKLSAGYRCCWCCLLRVASLMSKQSALKSCNDFFGGKQQTGRC